MDKTPAYGDNDAFNENVAILRACLDKTIADLHDLVFHPDNEIPDRFEDDEPEEDFVREEPVIPCELRHEMTQRRHGTSRGTRKRKQTRQQKITAHYTRLEKQLKLILAAQKSALAQAELEQQKTDTDNKAVNDAKAKEEAEATEYLLGVFERVGKRMAEESQDQYIQGGPGVYEKLMNMHQRE
jgi:hypothetical protein